MPSARELLADLTGGDEARAEIAAGLLALRGHDIFTEIEPLLESADADIRWWAIRTVGGMAEPRMDWLRRGLADGSADVRAAAALGLATHPDESSVPVLLKAVSDEDGVVAVLVVRALVAIGRAAVPALMEAFDGAGPRGQIQIMRAIAGIRDPRAIRLMMEVLGTNSALQQHWAREGLDMLGLDMVYMMPE